MYTTIFLFTVSLNYSINKKQVLNKLIRHTQKMSNEAFSSSYLQEPFIVLSQETHSWVKGAAVDHLTGSSGEVTTTPVMIMSCRRGQYCSADCLTDYVDRGALYKQWTPHWAGSYYTEPFNHTPLPHMFISPNAISV